MDGRTDRHMRVFLWVAPRKVAPQKVIRYGHHRIEGIIVRVDHSSQELSVHTSPQIMSSHGETVQTCANMIT